MQLRELDIPGVFEIVPQRFTDARGYFTETWNQRRLREAGIALSFVQDNMSFNRVPNVVRGLHYQAPPHAQAKLVSCPKGAVRDVVADFRRGSPAFGLWLAATLSAENGAQLLVPAGCLHGFVVLEADTLVQYKVDAHYAPDCDRAIRFDDPDLAIDWGIPRAAALVSDKDAAAPTLREVESPFVFGVPT